MIGVKSSETMSLPQCSNYRPAPGVCSALTTQQDSTAQHCTMAEEAKSTDASGKALATSTIKAIKARSIYDSRGNPTVEVQHFPTTLPAHHFMTVGCP